MKFTTKLVYHSRDSPPHLNMLPHYYGKLEVQIRCVSKSASF